MIDEAIGKVLGMAMAYVASAMGMFVAYVNYRKRIVKADKIMTPAAWAVLLLSALAVAGGVLVVVQLATAPSAEEVKDEAAPEPLEAVVEVQPPPVQAEVEGARDRWPWVGIVVPALIFLFATVVTAALHRHFSAHDAGH